MSEVGGDRQLRLAQVSTRVFLLWPVLMSSLIVIAQVPPVGPIGAPSQLTGSVEFGSRYGKLLDLRSPCQGCLEHLLSGSVRADLFGRIPITISGRYRSQHPINGTRTAIRIGLDTERAGSLVRQREDLTIGRFEHELDSTQKLLREAKADLVYWKLVAQGAAQVDVPLVKEMPVEQDTLPLGEVGPYSTGAAIRGSVSPDSLDAAVNSLDTVLLQLSEAQARLEELQDQERRLQERVTGLQALEDSLTGARSRTSGRVSAFDIGQFSPRNVPLLLEGTLMNGVQVGLQLRNLGATAIYGNSIRPGFGAAIDDSGLAQWAQRSFGLSGDASRGVGDQLICGGLSWGEQQGTGLGIAVLRADRTVAAGQSALVGRNLVYGMHGSLQLHKVVRLRGAFAASELGPHEGHGGETSTSAPTLNGAAQSLILELRPHRTTMVTFGADRYGRDYMSYGLAFIIPNSWSGRIGVEQRVGKRLRFDLATNLQSRSDRSGSEFNRVLGTARASWRITSKFRFDYGWSSSDFAVALANSGEVMGAMRAHRCALAFNGRSKETRVSVHLMGLNVLTRVDTMNTSLTSVQLGALLTTGIGWTWRTTLTVNTIARETPYPRIEAGCMGAVSPRVRVAGDVNARYPGTLRLGGSFTVTVALAPSLELQGGYLYNEAEVNYLPSDLDYQGSVVSIGFVSIRMKW